MAKRIIKASKKSPQVIVDPKFQVPINLENSVTESIASKIKRKYSKRS